MDGLIINAYWGHHLGNDVNGDGNASGSRLDNPEGRLTRQFSGRRLTVYRQLFSGIGSQFDGISNSSISKVGAG